MVDVPFFTLPLYPGTNIILSVFLLIGLSGSVLTFFWAVPDYYTNKCRVSVFVILLLTNNILELLLNLYIIVKLCQEDKCEDMTCRILSSFWSALRVCGVFLQQMMVLEADLALRSVLCCAHVFFPCSVIISAVGFMLFFLSIFSAAPPFHLFSLLPPLAVTVSSCSVTCGRSPIKIHSADRNKRREYVVLTFALFTMILYLLFLIAYVSRSSWSLWVLCLLSLRVIIDPLLWWMVSEKIRTDPETDHVSAWSE